MRPLQRAAGFLALLLLSGCATVPTVDKKKEGRRDPMMKTAVEKPEEERPPAPPVVEDIDLLSEGIALLSHPDRPDSSTKARSVFLSLLQHFPMSRWRPAAETFIRLIDAAEASRELNRQERLSLEEARAERGRLHKENDGLRQTIRELTERLQAETAALTQENEQLKKDLQRLKLLEIELQKRERMLR
jgi:hypothetical protein